MDYATFLANFPEFGGADESVILAALANATALCPYSRWRALQTQGIGLRAAQALALSPFARNMALAKDDGSTVYDGRLKELFSIVSIGGMVI